MQGYLDEVCKERGLDAAQYQEQLLIICKNANYLEITRLKSFKEEIDKFELEEEFFWSLGDDEEPCHTWYVLARCFEDFKLAKKYYPGQVIENDKVTYPNVVNQEDVEWIKN